MKLKKICYVILILFVLLPFIRCKKSKSSSILENPDIALVIEQLPEHLFNPTSLNTIFLEDSVLIAIHHSMHKSEYKGIEEISSFYKNEGCDWNNIKTILKEINVVNTQADVNFTISYGSGNPGQQIPWECECTAKLIKIGSNWLIKECIIENIL